MRTKHIDIKYQFLKQHVMVTSEFEMVYVNTHDQLADLLTKPLNVQRIKELRGRVMGYEG